MDWENDEKKIMKKRQIKEKKRKENIVRLHQQKQK